MEKQKSFIKGLVIGLPLSIALWVGMIGLIIEWI